MLRKVTLLFVISAAVASLATVSKFSAQPPIEPVARNIHQAAFVNPEWSSDGKTLVYNNIFKVEQPFIQYAVESKTFTQSAVHPSLINITQAQMQLLDAQTDQTSILYASPNGRYVVYAAPRSLGTWEDGRQFIALADLLQDKTMIVNLPLDVWTVKWSADSHVFAIETQINSGTIVYYFSNFQQSVTQVKHVILTNFVKLEGGYIADRVYAVSSDGSSVLLAGGREVALWQASGSLNITPFAQGIIYRAAAFTSDETGAFYLTKTGMFRYDFATQQTTPVALEAGTELLKDAEEAVISADGRHVAVVVYERATYTFALYILNVAQGQ